MGNNYFCHIIFLLGVNKKYDILVKRKKVDKSIYI